MAVNKARKGWTAADKCCTSTRQGDYIKRSSLWQRRGGMWRRVLGLTDYFGKFLSPQWNTREFGADSAESSTQDPLGFFTVGRVVLVRTEKGMTPWKSNWIIQRRHIKRGAVPHPVGFGATHIATHTVMSIYNVLKIQFVCIYSFSTLVPLRLKKINKVFFPHLMWSRMHNLFPRPGQAASRELKAHSCATVAGQSPVRHSLVVVFMSTEAAAAQQREEDNQQKGDQGSRCDHTHPLVGLWKTRSREFWVCHTGAAKLWMPVSTKPSLSLRDANTKGLALILRVIYGITTLKSVTYGVRCCIY